MSAVRAVRQTWRRRTVRELRLLALREAIESERVVLPVDDPGRRALARAERALVTAARVAAVPD